MLHPFGCFLILPILLCLQAFSQIALTIAVELWLIPVFAEDAGNVFPIELIMRDDSPRTNRWKQRCKQQNV